MGKIKKLLLLDNIELVPESIIGKFILYGLVSFAVLIICIIVSFIEKDIRMPLIFIAGVLIYMAYLYFSKMRPFLNGKVRKIHGRVIKEPSSGGNAVYTTIKNKISRCYIYFRDDKGKGYQFPVSSSKGIPYEGTDIDVYYIEDNIPQINRGFIYIQSPVFWESSKNAL